MLYQNLTTRPDLGHLLRVSPNLQHARVYANSGDYTFARARRSWFRNEPRVLVRLLWTIDDESLVDWEN